MYGNSKKEFGDYQTPIEFCLKVCKYLKNEYTDFKPEVIFEPTCGIGNFLYAASAIFSCSKVYGIEINEQYAAQAQAAVPNAKIIVKNIFNLNTGKIDKEDTVLIIGNPPWATNANLYLNLPQKTNFKGLKGIDALTGSSNFDISEYIILQLLNEYKGTNSLVCMLCKTSVARNVILEIKKNKIAYQRLEILTFNGNKVFGIFASACVFIIQLSAFVSDNTEIVCYVKDFDNGKYMDTLIVSDGVIKSSAITDDLDGKCQMIWRQGVKHDCSKIMELDYEKSGFINKNKEQVQIENTLIFPLVKSSHFKKPIIHEFSKAVIVTQRTPKQDTSYIKKELPLTWKYLTEHIDYFNNRKSSIYKNSAPFSMFGIGDYSFASYKVGLSGFYKKPLFSLLYSDKPVMTDDTAYFLAFDNYDNAYCMMLLLNSDIVQRFLLSIAFLDNKRPYTVKLLSRLDLKKCIQIVSFEKMQKSEEKLKLDKYITAEMYNYFTEFINSLNKK